MCACVCYSGCNAMSSASDLRPVYDQSIDLNEVYVCVRARVMCVCVCVCVRARVYVRGGGEGGERARVDTCLHTVGGIRESHSKVNLRLFSTWVSPSSARVWRPQRLLQQPRRSRTATCKGPALCWPLGAEAAGASYVTDEHASLYNRGEAFPSCCPWRKTWNPNWGAR